jgi:hypothetical protein
VRPFHGSDVIFYTRRCASSSTAEQRTLNPQVRGSNPRRRTAKYLVNWGKRATIGGSRDFANSTPIRLSDTCTLGYLHGYLQRGSPQRSTNLLKSDERSLNKGRIVGEIPSAWPRTAFVRGALCPARQSHSITKDLELSGREIEDPRRSRDTSASMGASTKPVRQDDPTRIYSGPPAHRSPPTPIGIGTCALRVHHALRPKQWVVLAGAERHRPAQLG